MDHVRHLSPRVSLCRLLLGRGRDFVCPNVQCRVTDAVARPDQVDEGRSAALEYGERQFLHPLLRCTSDPTPLVVTGLWQRVSSDAPGDVVDGGDFSRVSPDRSSGFVDDGSRFGDQSAPPIGKVPRYPSVRRFGP